MAHPLFYVSGNTQNHEFPLILTIGREPNYDEMIDDSIGIIDDEEFGSMSGGVWVTAYTQLAKQYLGNAGTARQLKAICFDKNSSPIVFANAFPMAIPNSVVDKQGIRNKLISSIPAHIAKIFSSSLSPRFQLVIQHGGDRSEPSMLATRHIESACANRGIPYLSSPFFYNGNSKIIQIQLDREKLVIQRIFDDFIGAK